MVHYDRSACDFCGVCVGVCPADCITLGRVDLSIDHDACIECEACVELCPTRALAVGDEEVEARR